MKQGILNGDNYRRGTYLALGAAFISGLSVYINKFAVEEMSDPCVFTAAKNIAVALMLFALFLLPRALPEMRVLSLRQWLTLGFIGCVGGSIPFLLFFQGLSLGTSAGAGFIHKTMFLWVAILAVFFLREKPGKLQLAALAVLVGGNVLLLGWPKDWGGGGETLMLAATLFWAVEAVVARRIMRNISSNVAAFARMCFGSIVMLIYLGMVGKLGMVAGLSMDQAGWIALTGLFLLGYVTCYYAGLKHAPATVVTSILVLGSVITSALYAILDAKRYSGEEMAGLAMISLAAVSLWYLSGRMTASKGDTTLPVGS